MRRGEALDAPIALQLVELLDANYGTTLEWFGDATHISEVKAFASEHSIGPFDDSAPAFRDRVKRVIEAAMTRGEVNPAANGLTVPGTVQTLLFAAHGAKPASKDGATGSRASLETLVGVIVRGLHAQGG